MENTLIWLQEMEDNNESWVKISSVITMLKKEQEQSIDYSQFCTESPCNKCDNGIIWGNDRLSGRSCDCKK